MNIANMLTAEAVDKMTPDLIDLIRQTDPNLAAAYEQAMQQHKPQLIFWLDKFITQNPEMLELKRKIRIVAGEPDPVLLVGDTGTGKELLAHALHANRSGKFIPVNCAGIPEQLMESELFGHVRGSFTGAERNKLGILAEAKNGTVFLDEIGDLPLVLQSKLLRSLQEQTIRPVGSNDEIDINCRIVSATHKDLVKLTSYGQFREDLYWRISTITLRTLPLSVRHGDLPLLIRHFDPEESISNVEYFISCIDKSQHLRGNVRSLQQLIRRYQLFNEYPS